MKINTISPLDNKFLQITDSIVLMPKKFYYIGKLPDTRPPVVAIVGTRKPTRYGIEVTTMFASELARRGVIIISGMALGVDAIAHRATLDAGGITIAVQANGLAKLTPTTNRQLGEDIVRGGGAIISEYEPNTPPKPYTFLERNRIVSGLADAVLITEASARSGTLNTASHALNQGKDVFVVPGNITSPTSAGCNALIKQGAYPVTSVEDILSIVAPASISEQAPLPLGDNPVQTQIIHALQSGKNDGDDIREMLKISAQELSSELTMLEINGVVRALGANRWTIR